MSIGDELLVMKGIEELNAFLVEPVLEEGGDLEMLDSPHVWVSYVVEDVETAASHLGRVLYTHEDGNVIIEQQSNRVEGEVEDEDGNPETRLIIIEEPLKWRMRVSKTELKCHVPSLDQNTA